MRCHCSGGLSTSMCSLELSVTTSYVCVLYLCKVHMAFTLLDKRATCTLSCCCIKSIKATSQHWWSPGRVHQCYFPVLLFRGLFQYVFLCSITNLNSHKWRNQGLLWKYREYMKQNIKVYTLLQVTLTQRTCRPTAPSARSWLVK